MFHTLRCALTPFRPHLHLSVYADAICHDALTTVLIVYGPANARTVAAQQPGKPQPAALHHVTTAIDSPTPRPDAYNVSFYTTRPSTAAAMLRRYVDLTRQLDFAGLQRYHRPLLDDVRRQYQAEHAGQHVELDYEPCNHWDYPFTVPLTSSSASPTASSRARIARLPATLDTGALIASQWPYSSPHTASFIHSLLLAEHALQPSDVSYGAYRGDELVAWEVKQPYGAIGQCSLAQAIGCRAQCDARRLTRFLVSVLSGMLHVKDSERRSGVARQLIQRVVEVAVAERMQPRAAAAHSGNDGGQQQADTDGRVRVYDEHTPFCYTTDNNAASRRLFESLGFEYRFDVDWITWTPLARDKP